MKKLVFIPSLLLFAGVILQNCSESESNDSKKNDNQEKENVAGGPCSYSSDTLPAIILNIYPVDGDKSELEFYQCYSINETDPEYCDTLSYRIINNSYAENSELEKINLKTGDTVCYIMQQITEGSCSPNISFYVLERYNKFSE